LPAGVPRTAIRWSGGYPDAVAEWGFSGNFARMAASRTCFRSDRIGTGSAGLTACRHQGPSAACGDPRADRGEGPMDRAPPSGIFMAARGCRWSATMLETAMLPPCASLGSAKCELATPAARRRRSTSSGLLRTRSCARPSSGWWWIARRSVMKLGWERRH